MIKVLQTSKIIEKKLAGCLKKQNTAKCPSDQRVEQYLHTLLNDTTCQLPQNTLILDTAGLARELSLPKDKHIFKSPYVTSYRVDQGVLHNPLNDRRTTKGVFHICEGGLPIPDDKIAVSKHVFANIFRESLNPPKSVLKLPYTSLEKSPIHTFVSLLLRPLVVPEIAGINPAMSMEIRFFAPASLISNLDFVESIFGNGGNPTKAENDAALDLEHWTGHTGCVILAPHLTMLTKKALGLPHLSEATERQKRDGQCWTDENELYNNGDGFKITSRDKNGVIVTVIADNYFGYCKKEVKTQISYAANLFGTVEEEHAGGAIAFPSQILGQDYYPSKQSRKFTETFEDTKKVLGKSVTIKPQGYAIDKNYPSIIYLPENSEFNVRKGHVSWLKNGKNVSLQLLAEHTYILPWGYKVRLEKQIGGTSWRLVGSQNEGALCHKPCTVSGGGKSEISKSIANAMLQGPVFVRDFETDIADVDNILKKDFSNIYLRPEKHPSRHRPILSLERSLGSVVKLLTPSSDYTDEHNAWVKSLHQTTRTLVFVVKRYYRPEWGDNWKKHFSVDRVNGYLGHELKYDDHKLVANYLRMGFDKNGSWRIHKVRPDFNPADKVQMEDDITASAVLPRNQAGPLYPAVQNESLKFVANCEQLLFQRPDDAIHRGFDKQAELDIASENTFFCNFEPLPKSAAQKIANNIMTFDQYSEPMKARIKNFLNSETSMYVVISDHPRIVDGKPSKNPRYLQKRPDIVNAKETYIATIGARLARQIPDDEPVHFPVNAVLAGRRNNPPDKKLGIPPLAIFNPIHYQELPELFMDFICSLTGKSPSTTGFGTEGALTKGPFNALLPIIDLNNSLVSFILTGYAGFTTAAGHVGPIYKFDHDISLLVPELWSRMSVEERDPQILIRDGFIEKLEDFKYNNELILASRLGYRITSRFVDRFLGRIFETPNMVFPEQMLKPEKQDMETYVEGIKSVVEAQARVAEYYFNDGSIHSACPPLKALLTIMKTGEFEGKRIEDADIRSLFTRESLISSDWYQERLKTKQNRDEARLLKFTSNIEAKLKQKGADASVLKKKLSMARQQLSEIQSKTYLTKLFGTIGADPFKLPHA